MSFRPTQAELAIARWLVRASNGLPVVWGNLNGAPPAYPFILIARLSSQKKGMYDRVSYSYDASRPAGEEIEAQVIGQREVAFSVEVITDNANLVGDRCAFEIAESLSAQMQLPTICEDLQNNGLYPFDYGTVVNLTKLIKVAFEGRAQFDVRFYTSRTFSEFYGYIHSVNGTVVGVPWSAP